jgi:hypothetical protein
VFQRSSLNVEAGTIDRTCPEQHGSTVMMSLWINAIKNKVGTAVDSFQILVRPPATPRLVYAIRNHEVSVLPSHTEYKARKPNFRKLYFVVYAPRMAVDTETAWIQRAN